MQCNVHVDAWIPPTVLLHLCQSKEKKGNVFTSVDVLSNTIIMTILLYILI